MAPSYTLPTVDELHEIALAYWGNLIPEDDLSRGSDEWARSRVLALMCADINYNGSIQLRDAMPDTTEGEALEEWLTALDLERGGATVVTGEAVLRLRGVDGATFDAGATLTHASGIQYALLDSGAIDPEGFIDVDITSITAGSAAKLTAGQVLRFDTVPTDIEQNAELIADLVDGGDDIESEPAARARLADAISRRKLGHTVADYERWILEAGVSAAKGYVYRGRNGLGTVDVAAFKVGEGDGRSLSYDERTALLEYIDERRAPTMAARVLETTSTDADVRVHVVPMPGVAYAADWNTGGVDFEVDTWTSATRVLKLNEDRPVSLRPGHRIVVNNGTGEPVVVEALGPASDEVTLRAPLPTGFAPVAADRVWPGGPLTEIVRDAVKAWINALGPRLGSYGSGWKGSLYLSDVFLVTQTAEGVLDSEVKTLAGGTFSTVEPPEYLYPDDGFVGFLKPGRVLVVYTSTL